MLAVDFHVHTLASGHAFNTVYELSQAGAAMGIQAIAITDHGPAAEGAPAAPYFHVLADRVPKMMNGVRLIKGIEANILDSAGRTDIPVYAIAILELVLAAMHPITEYRDAGSAANTRAVVNALDNNPAIDILAHPVNAWYPMEIATVVREATSRGVALELNEASMARGNLPLDRVRQMIELGLQCGGRFAISSDSHIASELGSDNHIGQLLAELAVPQQCIVNHSLAAAEAFIAERRQTKQPA